MKQLLAALGLGVGLLAFAAPGAYALEPQARVFNVQAGDPSYRVSVLEEQVRQLTGRVEELNFQLLELQELVRRLQEDNDFRLRELEEQRGSLGSPSEDKNTDFANQQPTGGDTSPGKVEPSGQGEDVARLPDGNDNNTGRRTLDGVELYDGEAGVDPNRSGTLGSLRFDENGNIIDTELGKPLDLTTPRGGELNNGIAGDGVAALPGNPDSLFDLGLTQVRTGRYEEAEKSFVAFSDRYQDHPRLPEARFWLGESYLGRQEYQDAARVYLDAHKRFPNSKFAPQSLLKLGISVAGLNQRELACATFAQVLQKYPNASGAVRRNVAQQQRATQCALN